MENKEKKYRDSQRQSQDVRRKIEDERKEFLLNSLKKAQSEITSKKYPREERGNAKEQQ